ncbi:hypothetical protein ACQRIT_000193 [Beauveria bassiana]
MPDVDKGDLMSSLILIPHTVTETLISLPLSPWHGLALKQALTVKCNIFAVSRQKDLTADVKSQLLFHLSNATARSF